ncbi:hypothetical protein [Pedobacter aquatilis]|uniref:hypothetical protein n=1 Tax=Pedobacter aquatilis TaxID=351343 RepID=UPI0039777A21
MEEVWTEHQMHTTVNFATNSPIAAFFRGGLYRQIEYHLFPKICHVRYGLISVVVKKQLKRLIFPIMKMTRLHQYSLLIIACSTRRGFWYSKEPI